MNACKVLLSTPYRTLHTSISWLEFSGCDLKSALDNGSLCLPTCSYAWKQEFLICLLKAFISEKWASKLYARHIAVVICRLGYLDCTILYVSPRYISCTFSYTLSVYKYFFDIMSMYTIACRFGWNLFHHAFGKRNRIERCVRESSAQKAVLQSLPASQNSVSLAISWIMNFT